MKKKLKALIEKRNGLVADMEAITELAATEVRALTEEEDERFAELRAEVEALDSTIDKLEESIEARIAPADEADGGTAETTEETELRAFASYIRGTVEERADYNLTKGDNGAVIPKTIADRIVKTMYDVSPILERATTYNVKGTLELPYYNESTHSVTVAYATEFQDPSASVGSFATVTLNGYLAEALTLVSKSLLNSTDFDLVAFVVNDMAEKIARFLEGELLNGTSGKIEGLSTCANTVTAASTSAITLDELIDVQDKVVDAYQQNAIWIMSSSTRAVIRKMKDTNGHPLLQQDITNEFGYMLLGKPVYCSDNMADIAASANVIYYGDMSGLAVKFTEAPNVQVLIEAYATKHSIGVLGCVEADSKIQVPQAIANLKMKAS